MPYIPQGRPKPNFPLGIAIGNESFSELGGIHKYGYNADIDTAYETVWEKGGAFTFATTAATVGVTSATHSASNSGVKVRVAGLDANYDQISEVITLDSTGDATTTQSFLRINRAFIVGNTNLSADIDLEIGSTTVLTLDTTHQQTMQCVFTVPAGKTAYLMLLQAGSSVKDKNIEMIVRQTVNGVTRSRDYVAFTDQLTKEYVIPVKFNEKTDIQVMAKSATANANVFGSFDLIMEDN